MSKRSSGKTHNCTACWLVYAVTSLLECDGHSPFVSDFPPGEEALPREEVPEHEGEKEVPGHLEPPGVEESPGLHGARDHGRAVGGAQGRNDARGRVAPPRP